MITIIEGVDGLGKTTLAKNIALGMGGTASYKSLSSPFFGQSVEASQGEDRGIAGVLAALHPHVAFHLIMDRWYPSDFAYGKVYGRTFNEAELFELDRFVAENLKVSGVLLRPTRDWSEEDLRSRGVDDVRFADWQKLDAYYEAFARQSFIDWKTSYVTPKGGEVRL